ncbi:Ku protein [Halopseudomonas pelagia]|uniref:Non-homologous end joining protein Ku n=1 Tax=Halopseudomonas pelagia TaxID=553151 RepID=A0AA91U4G8_9GAMM|nr:Ku protein [Halopseudomonas pelagia]PCC99866.1 Ku protein [Halopseudomonas pelagia]QFY56272.1 Ku protein [Halopseudomonas pelagia]
MARAIWKGAISFGLVHIPVALVSATSSKGIDFDWLDKRSMDRVGYKRINKVTGKEITSKHIVKGVEYEKDRYVVISEEEIAGAHPKATQTIDIFAFVDSAEIPLINIRKPYFLSPERRGEKVYALLRETLVKTGKVALANVVVRTRQSLAALMPLDSALVVVMLRWPDEVRSLDRLNLNEEVSDPSLSKQELDMARKLVEDMTSEWKAEEYRDTFGEKIMQLVEEKAKAGKIESVEQADDDQEERRSADVVDLTELLKRSLAGKGKGGKAPAKSPAKKRPASKAKADDEDSQDSKPARRSSK